VPLSVTDEYNNDGAYEAVMSWTFESLHVGPQVRRRQQKRARRKGVAIACARLSTSAHSHAHAPSPRAQDPSVFELPHPWTHKRCKRHIGGWPYLHLFHHYLKI
jgi:hypothetical protein